MNKVKEYFWVAFDWVNDHRKISAAVLILLLGYLAGRFL